MLKAYKYRLHPNAKQTRLLQRNAGCVRYVFNRLLDYRSKSYKRRGESTNYYDCIRLLLILKEAKPWLKEAYSQSLQMAARNLDSAFDAFFTRGAGYPKFKKKDSCQSVQYPQGVKIDWSRGVFLPKIGWVEAVFHRRFTHGKIKTCTLVIESSGIYEISILVETDEGKALPKTEMPLCKEDVLGVDAGIKSLAVTSDGKEYGNPHSLAKMEKRLVKEQRKLSRKKKGSSNRRKQKKKVARIHRKIRDIRKDAIEKASSAIVRESQAAVAVEDLNVKGMMKNHNLAKAIADASFSSLIVGLEDKCRREGKLFVKVDRFYPSSKTCHVCGYVNDELTLDMRGWRCPLCQSLLSRDENAALNIRDEGYRLIAKLPMDGGEVTTVETATVDESPKGPKEQSVVETVRVLQTGAAEAPCL